MQKRDGEVKHLIERLRRDFERHMNDDLNVKQAFDALLSTLLQLTKRSRKNKVTTEDVKRILATRTRIHR